MLDKSLPYYNIIMKREKGTPLPEPKLNPGFYFSCYSAGDEEAWAKIECSIGEFDTPEDALQYFKEKYFPDQALLSLRMLFIQDRNKEKIATLTNWWDMTGTEKTPSLNWIGVKPDFQGLGLGKAIIFEGLRQMISIEGDVDVFLHTQTWSYRAVNIYLNAGFKFCENDVFGTYQNDYPEYLEILRDKIR